MTAWQEEVWQWLAAVPRGKVASYGQIAGLAGRPRHARQVGTILHKLPPDSSLPWHRIVRSNGSLAFAPGSEAWQHQRRLLAREGIIVAHDRVSMGKYQWRP